MAVKVKPCVMSFDIWWLTLPSDQCCVRKNQGSQSSDCRGPPDSSPARQLYQDHVSDCVLGVLDDPVTVAGALNSRDVLQQANVGGPVGALCSEIPGGGGQRAV
jgi:hypothetical protein